MNEQKQGVTALGAIVSALLVVGLIALGVYMIRRHAEPASSAPSGEMVTSISLIGSSPAAD